MFAKKILWNRFMLLGISMGLAITAALVGIFGSENPETMTQALRKVLPVMAKATEDSLDSQAPSRQGPQALAAAKKFYERHAEIDIDKLSPATDFGLSDGLVEFVNIKAKTLASQDDKANLDNLLSNSSLSEEVFKGLTVHNKDEQQAVARRRRVVLVDFLQQALANESSRHQALQQAQQILTSPIPAKDDSKDVQRGYVGDRIEIALMVAKVSPEIFAEIKDKVRNSPMEKVLAYAESLIAHS